VRLVQKSVRVPRYAQGLNLRQKKAARIPGVSASDQRDRVGRCAREATREGKFTPRNGVKNRGKERSDE